MLLTLSGLRRYPSERSHLVDMPGRGSLTFLIIGNVTVWIVRTALVKELSSSTQIDYYGTLTWLLLLNLNLPLLLFFRFHSSVCLADVWHTAYTSPVHNCGHGNGGAAANNATIGGSASAAKNGNGKMVEQLASSAGVSTLMRSYSLPHLAIAAKQQHCHGGTSSTSNAASAAHMSSSAAESAKAFPHIEGVEMIDDGDDGFTSLVDATIG